MKYAFQIWPHANIRYMESLKKLSLAELKCILGALNIEATPQFETIGGAPFLVFEASPLSPVALKHLFTHSALYMLWEIQGETFTPITPAYPWYLGSDLAEILKYRGKTNASFTMLLLNLALTAGDYFNSEVPLTILDPLCGKATTLFCALRRGDNAIGIELDKKALKECGDFFAKYLQSYRFKHKKALSSLTLQKGKAAPKTAFTFANDATRFENGATRSLDLILADTLDTAHLLKPESVHLIAADLPYGVQHAPGGGAKEKGLIPLLKKALPGWRQVLKKGGTIALSFNTFTLSKADLSLALKSAGFTVLNCAPYDDFDHYVEQAVNRDVVIAKKEA
jgi:Predicted DNA modification methylase